MEKTEGVTPEEKPETEEQRSAAAPVEKKPEPKTEPETRELEKLDPAELERMADARAAAEIDRRESIGEIAKRFNIEEKEMKRAIKEKDTVDAFRLRVLESLEKNNPAFSPQKAENEIGSQKGSRTYTIETWGRAVEDLPSLKGKVKQMPISEANLPERRYIDGEGVQFHRSLTGAVTLLDVAKIDAGIGSPIIDETILHAPELQIMPVDVISGSTVELSVRTDTPTVGYRNANEGREFKRGTFESKVFQTSIIEEPIGVDIQGVLNSSSNPGRVLMAEASVVTSAVMQHVAQQMWYAGTAQSIADAKCAPGLYAQYSADTTHEVDATGTTAKSSIWFVQLGMNMLDTIFGNNATLTFGDSWTEEMIEDASGGKLRALVNWISGRNAVRLSNKNAAVRIKNIGTASGKTATDALMFQGLQKCDEIGLVPNAIFMTPRSQYQIQASRTATTTNGAPAPLPTMWNGIPIYVTRNLLNAETV